MSFDCLTHKWRSPGVACPACARNKGWECDNCEKLKAELSKGTEVMFTALRTENQKLKGKLYGPKGRDAELTALRAEIERHINLRTQDIANLQATQSNKERLKRMYAELEAELDEAVKVIEWYGKDASQKQTAGAGGKSLENFYYDRGRRAKDFLSKHPKRGEE